VRYSTGKSNPNSIDDDFGSVMDQNRELEEPLPPTLVPSDPAPFPFGDPSQIGRYRVIRFLGKGGFGRVYLAHDDELDRAVAIKVPNPERISSPKDLA